MTAPRSDIDAVTWLFVPGDRPDRFDKAASSGAQAVIIDLEDAVPPDRKDQARGAVTQWLQDAGHRAFVRINAVASPWHTADLEALAGCVGLAGVMVPKAQDPDELVAARDRLGGEVGAVRVVALVESALGVHRAVDLARCPAVDRLAFGSIDFAADIGSDESWDALLSARTSLVLASRIGEIPGPIDGVSTALRDPQRLRADVTAARSLGYTGKLCLHPSQLADVTAGFAPTADEVQWARRVVEADRVSGGAATTLDGAMVDRPVVARARALLHRAPTS